MINTKQKLEKTLLLTLSFIFIVLLLNFISAEGEVNYCCEKTVSGAWCQNAPESQCDSSFRKSPTSCDSTSYCKPGCCFDSQEGICLESTPQRVCNDNGATWVNNSQCDVPQCRLGCCVLADQGAFVTLTRCKQLSGFFGLETDFRKDITDELTCIATASSSDKGACIYEDSETVSRTCVFTTRAECKGAIIGTINETNISGDVKVFYKDVLCTAEELGTTCGKTTKTTLIPGKDEVYYLDTCGNIANIYDSERYNDDLYWKKVFKKQDSCGAGTSNANSKTCGNCDYYYGSIGKKASGVLGLGTPVYGNYICADLNCKKEGKKHGESWCIYDTPNGDGLDTVGSRYFKVVCLNGEILKEPCADFRNEICVEDNFGSFTEAACRVNRWQNCLQQEEQADCENYDQRDCRWINGYYYSANSGQIEKSNNDSKKGALTPEGICTPNYPPGSNFWGSTQSASTSLVSSVNQGRLMNSSPDTNYGTGYVAPSTAGATSSASSQCSVGNAKVTVKWSKTSKPLMDIPVLGDLFFGGDEDEAEGRWKCIENCAYTSQDNTADKPTITESDVKKWAGEMNSICYSLGDCGGYINFNQVYTDDGYAAYFNSRRLAGSGGVKILEQVKIEASSSTPQGTAEVVKDLIKSAIGKS